MTAILHLIDTPLPGESWTETIARRLLGEFGQRRLSTSAVAREIGMSQSGLSRKMAGKEPFTIQQIEHLCAVIGIDRDYILTGARQLPASGGSLLVEPDDSLLLPRKDSNLQPFGEGLHTELPVVSGF